MKLYDTVERILHQKGLQVYSATPYMTVYEALQLMADKDIGALVVMDGPRVVGLLSERDYARNVILKGRSSKELQVHEIMTSPPVTIAPKTTIDECMQHMTNKRCRHLIVMDNEKVAGIVSIGDVVNWIITAQDFTIRQLESYIGGSYSA